MCVYVCAHVHVCMFICMYESVCECVIGESVCDVLSLTPSRSLFDSHSLSFSASIQKRLKKEKKAKRKLQEALEFESKRREQVEQALKQATSPDTLRMSLNGEHLSSCPPACLLLVITHRIEHSLNNQRETYFQQTHYPGLMKPMQRAAS